MYNFKTLRCYNCSSVIVNLPEKEIFKLNGLTLRCDCCNHKNLLKGIKFEAGLEENLSSIYSFLDIIA